MPSSAGLVDSDVFAEAVSQVAVAAGRDDARGCGAALPPPQADAVRGPEIARARRGEMKRGGGAEDVGLEIEADALRDVIDAADPPGVRHSRQPLIAQPSGPQAFLVPPADGALEVGAPRLGIGIEVHGLERDLDFDAPVRTEELHPLIRNELRRAAGLEPVVLDAQP